MIVFLTQWVYVVPAAKCCIIVSCTIVVPIKSVCAVEFLAVNCQYNFLRFHDNSENS